MAGGRSGGCIEKYNFLGIMAGADRGEGGGGGGGGGT